MAPQRFFFHSRAIHFEKFLHRHASATALSHASAVAQRADAVASGPCGIRLMTATSSSFLYPLLITDQ